jgi:hypothetical protein
MGRWLGRAVRRVGPDADTGRAMEIGIGIAGGLLGVVALVRVLATITQPILRLVPVEAIREPRRFPHSDPTGLRVPRA